MTQEPDTVEIYRSEYSLLIGSAVVIITAGKRGRSSVLSEAFVLLPDGDECELWAHRFQSSEFTTEFPDIGVDVAYMTRFAREQAVGWLDSRLWERFRVLGERIVPNPTVLTRSDIGELVSLRLRGKCAKAFIGIQNVSSSERLENVLQAVRSISVARDDELDPEV